MEIITVGVGGKGYCYPFPRKMGSLRLLELLLVSGAMLVQLVPQFCGNCQEAEPSVASGS